MTLLKFLFFVGIVFIILSLIWGLFMLILNLITFGERKGIFEETLLKGFNYYLLASLTAMLTAGQIGKSVDGEFGYKIGGLVMIYLYLIGRMQRQRIMVHFQKGMNQVKVDNTRSNSTLNTILLIATLALYSISVIYPEITRNAVVLWFYESIFDIYDTRILEIIFQIIGVFFLISIIFRGIMQTQKLVSSINKRMDKRSDGKDDDDYDDYEVIE